MDRRKFLGGGAVGVVVLGHKTAAAEAPACEAGSFSRLRLAALNEVRDNEPLFFGYPVDEHPCMLVKLGRAADGGVGPDHDIVAYSTICPHMGCSLAGGFKAERPGLLGPCPCHFSTFDLTRDGALIYGQSTQPLPRIVLEVIDDELYAIGVSGYLYGLGESA